MDKGIERGQLFLDSLDMPASASVPARDDVSSAPETVPVGDAVVHSYGGGRYELSPRGVFFIGLDKDGNALSPRWICSPLSVIAMTRDAKSGEWGRLLEWRDKDGIRHQWAMPMELLQGDGSDMRRELARLGLSIAPSKAARDLLASYLQVWPVEARARCVERLGWHGAVYVNPLPDLPLLHLTTPPKNQDVVPKPLPLLTSTPATPTTPPKQQDVIAKGGNWIKGEII